MFKTVSDPFVGRLSYLRSFVGDVKSDAHLWNPRQREEERVGQLFTLRGKTQEPTATIPRGDLGVVAKLAHGVEAHAEIVEYAPQEIGRERGRGPHSDTQSGQPVTVWVVLSR